MLNVKFPLNKYNTTDYPNLEDNAEGAVIPYLLGEKQNIKPVCIDTSANKYKVADEELGALKSIEAITADGTALSSGTDYTPDLANCEFTLSNTPLLQPNTTYYFILTGTYAIDGVNYTGLASDGAQGYSGAAYAINGADAWSNLNRNLSFWIYGKNSMTGEEVRKISTPDYADADHTTTYLRDHADRTKIGQAFTTPNDGQSWYITRIVTLGTNKVGSPSGNTQGEIHSDQVGTTVGIISNTYPIGDHTTKPNHMNLRWTQRGTPSEILVHAKGYKNADDSLMDEVGNILHKILNDVLGVSDSYIDTSALTGLNTQYAEAICCYLNEQVEFSTFLNQLSVAPIFAFLEKLDGTFTVKYPASGTPSGTYDLTGRHLMPDFQMERDLDNVKWKVIIKYNRDPSTGIYEEVSATSNVARYVYENQETIEFETFIKSSTDAQSWANKLSGLMEEPLQKASFSTRSGAGINQIPWEKVQLTRSRADYSGGSLSDVLFQINELTVNPGRRETRFSVTLDSQTIPS